ncbi:protein ANKUB1-like [Xyrichtys novacula]|uniref:Protein ANKUB1-like n=1 Tax=Xyrichtys novacula TaxID=13765 RepID=A0AAV1FHU5_XYRNO|nr:protein ANKUB1-like [Xyrichtys novacula]
MRILICFEGSCEPFDVPPNQTVGAVKQMVKENFPVRLSNDKQVRQYLELIYAGAALQDTWALSDVGIRSGSALQCLIKSEQTPVIRVFNAVTKETLLIMESEALLHISVARLKTLVSIQSGLPVSTFRLSTPAGVQLYDCNQLQDYAIDKGTTLRLDTWDGWVEFLQGCLFGHRLTVQSNLSESKPVMRFQLQVALYITASLGHLDLAVWLLERGVHPEEPVGVHPYRQWCHQTAHRDTGKCPVHIAAESSQIPILKLFIAKNPLALACQDPEGCDPLKIALQWGHRDVVQYLANKLYSVVLLPNMSLPMYIYLQIKRWVSVGQKRAASNRCQYTSAAFKARMGDKLLIDGFNLPNMSSKSRKLMTKPTRGLKMKTLQPVPPNSNLFSDCMSTRVPLRPSREQSVKLYDLKQKEKLWQHDSKHRNNGVLKEINDEDNNLCRGKFILPPISKNSITGSVFIDASQKSSSVLTACLENFSNHCGWTPRENAIYCLTTARAFTEKPWPVQLQIARTLIRKHVHTTI